MCFWCRCSLSSCSCRLHVSLLWDSSSWSWVCHSSSWTGRPGSPAVEAAISRHWPEKCYKNRTPTKAFKRPLICRVLSQSQTGKFGCAKRRTCVEPSPTTKKKRKKAFCHVMRRGGRGGHRQIAACSDWIRTYVAPLSQVTDSKKKWKKRLTAWLKWESNFRGDDVHTSVEELSHFPSASSSVFTGQKTIRVKSQSLPLRKKQKENSCLFYYPLRTSVDWSAQVRQVFRSDHRWL